MEKDSINAKASELLSSLTQEEIESKANSVRRKRYIHCSIWGAFGLYLVFYFIIGAIATSISAGELDTSIAGLIFALSPFLAGSIICFVIIGKTKKKTNNELALIYLQKEAKTSLEMVSHSLYIQRQIGDFSFSATSTFFLRSIKLYIDSTHKLVVFEDRAKIKCYPFSDIISYEVYENDSQILKGRAGSAAVGGILFGPVGAIVGANRAKGALDNCTHLKIIVRVNDITNPQYNITFFQDRGGLQKNSKKYSIIMEKLQQCCSLLEFILNNKPKENQQININIDSHNNEQDKKDFVDINQSKNSNVDDLIKYKKLLDDGVITQEEFESIKKKILNI